ncbi:hypothetical protein [Atlantibacter hermannii]|uniref:hypothetical protein n=1 Tax=Atlantibacter hermannii TaxID=565 RepID=UPI0028B1D556|nr:hypothetical protein [Atlantibacter hermannii]
MSESEQKIIELEKKIEEMQLDQHASRIAIAVLATAMNGLVNNNEHLGDLYLAGIAESGSNEFDLPIPDGYADALNSKVASLLGVKQ